MKNNKSNITVLIIILAIIGINIFEISQIKPDREIGITTHKLGYISCLSVEDNIKATITEGDSNAISISPNIEMFYSSGCLSIRGQGIASLTLQKNTLTALATEKWASVEGAIGDSLQYIQASGNSKINIKGGNIKTIEIQAKDKSIIKLVVTKIVTLSSTIKDYSKVEIYGKVESKKINQEGRGILKILNNKK